VAPELLTQKGIVQTCDGNKVAKQTNVLASIQTNGQLQERQSQSQRWMTAACQSKPQILKKDLVAS
jgi:hypothetical protein